MLVVITIAVGIIHQIIKHSTMTCQVIHDLAMIRDAPSLGARAVARKVWAGQGTAGGAEFIGGFPSHHGFRKMMQWLINDDFWRLLFTWESFIRIHDVRIS